MASSSGGGVPPGFRFHPTDEELLHYYLKKKVSFQKFDMEVIREVDLNKMEPWDLQERCKIGSTPQNEWYFFSHKDRKYPTGSRTNRATNSGFWKATGRDKCIRNSHKKIGMRKTLVFYRGRAPHGQKTDWIMHEYRLEDSDDDPQGNASTEDGWVVCRVFKKKNLFKINGNEGGGSGMNSGQQLNNPLNTNQPRTSFLHRDNQYLPRQQHNSGNQPMSFEPELALHQYSHMPSSGSHYSLFQSQPHLLPTQKPLGYDYSSGLPTETPIMVKQLMTNPRDCESGSDSLRYQANCEQGLEVGTCQPAPQLVTGRSDHHEGGMNEWAMLDRLVTSHIGNHDQESSKEVRFEEDPNTSSAPQINQLSLRGEMDFWGYEK